ncbi:hypothetical protein ACP70R_007517 [Stipagrostis hirtigluma subsp. patula]
MARRPHARAFRSASAWASRGGARLLRLAAAGWGCVRRACAALRRWLARLAACVHGGAPPAGARNRRGNPRRRGADQAAPAPPQEREPAAGVVVFEEAPGAESSAHGEQATSPEVERAVLVREADGADGERAISPRREAAEVVRDEAVPEDGAHGELAASSRRKRSASAAHPQEDDAPQEPGDGAASPRTKNAAAAVEEATSPTSKSTASLWEEVVRKKHKKPRSMLHQEAPPPHFPQSSQGKECFICKREGHLAKDCAKNKKWNTRQPKFSLRCEGMGHGMTEFAKGCLKNDIKHIEGEDSCHLDSLCAAKVDDPEEIAHKMYWKKVSLCKEQTPPSLVQKQASVDFGFGELFKDRTPCRTGNEEEAIAYATYCLRRSQRLRSKKEELCHICFFRRRRAVTVKKDKMLDHCWEVHKTDGSLCEKAGCVVRTENVGDAGVHKLYLHDMGSTDWWKEVVERHNIK